MACIGYGIRNTNFHYYAAINKCTESGGQWMPTSASGSCIRK